uniref:Uncharacterized protein n=1 Tax=Steinernema glaseri TaxID=37863 RepID=A0A1I7YLR5_9BILA
MDRDWFFPAEDNQCNRRSASCPPLSDDVANRLPLCLLLHFPRSDKCESDAFYLIIPYDSPCQPVGRKVRPASRLVHVLLRFLS